jgi:hypothetical protein
LPISALFGDTLINVTLPGADLVATFAPGSTEVNLYSRRIGDRELTFTSVGEERIRDDQTGTVWDTSTGRALDGNLEGERLPVHLGMLSYTNAWESFFPTSVRLPEE